MTALSNSAILNATLWTLLAFSIITWTLILVKGWRQWQYTQQNQRCAAAFWAAQGLDKAESITATLQGPLARLCQAGFAELRDLASGTQHNLQHSGDRQDILERCLRKHVQQEQHRLESGLTVLASIGNTAPFVGLFGTVWGIMHALQDISSTGSAGLDVVAGPIGEALISTAIGIATAIPAVLAYNYGQRRVRLMVSEMEEFATDFLHLAMKAGFQTHRQP